MTKRSVLVLCTGNSARSQMAEGLLRDLCGGEFDIYSAGTRPSIVRPEAVAAMAEIGIDISFHRSKSVDEFTGQKIDFVLTVCDNAREECPYFPGARKLVHHSFDDPAAVMGDEEQRLTAFRQTRDQMKQYFVAEFVPMLRSE